MISDEVILVAGGAGFIGSHLCEALVKADNDVLAIDDLSSGRVKNIEPLMKYENFDFIECDIIDLDEPMPVRDYKFMFNLASPASPPQYQNQPFQTMMTNVIGTHNLLEMAREAKSTFIQASTSEIYGDPEQHPQTEKYWGNVNPIGPRACYDEGKRAAETLCSDFNRVYDLDVSIARIFNTYGPNMDLNDGRVISNFIKAALLGRPLTVYGDGMQTRSLCYVTDTVDALIRMGDRLSGLNILNVGNPNEITMIELAAKIITRTRSQSKIEWGILPVDDPKRRKPDISLAKEKISWTPKVSLDDGLDMTIEYFRKELSGVQ